MKTIQKQLLLILAGAILSISIYGQELVAAAGENGTVGEISVSWAVGEVVTETVNADNLILTQGFYQDFYEITTMFESEIIDLLLDVYPNPTAKFLHVRKTENSEPLRFSLYDIHGKLYKTGEITDGDYTFDLRDYASSNFILRITTLQGQLVKTFQIAKVN